jgi:hypothetical protein
MAGTTSRYVYLPQTPDQLFKEAKIVLKDLGYTIETEDLAPLAVVSKGPFIIAKRGDYEAILTFLREQGETKIEVHVSQVGKKADTKVLENARDELVEKLNQLKVNK